MQFKRNFSPTVTIAVLATSGMVMAIMQTMFIPLLAQIPGILNCTADNASWLITATLISSVVAIPTMSRLADMYGKRKMMLISIGVMVIGSLIGALSENLGVLIVARALQGFAIALIPLGMSIMRDLIPPERLASGVAFMSGSMGVGSAIGLPFGGIIFESLGWHWIFWVSVITGSLCGLAIFAVVPESKVRAGGRFDVRGAVLISVALTAFLLGVTKGSHWGWLSPGILACWAVTLGVMLYWFPYELKSGHPIIDLRTSAQKAVLLTNIASMLVGFAMYANMLSSTQFLEMPEESGYGFGFSVSHAGLLILPASLSMVIMAPLAARITNVYGPKITFILGGLFLGIGYVIRMFYMDAPWQIMIGAIVVSLGTMTSMSAAPNIIMRSVPITETASANGLNNVIRNVGMSISSATVAAFLTGMTIVVGGKIYPSESAFTAVYVAAGICGFAGAVVAVFLPAHLAKRNEALSVGAGALAKEDPSQLTVNPHEFVMRGTLRDEQGNPVKQAKVTYLTEQGQQIDFERTDDDGSYSIVLPQPGSYRVVVEIDGQPTCEAKVQAAPENSLQELTI
ncbi:MAG: MFS transporter [Candidatus Nanopelagicales bacterium]|nr:MFS transporter [Candidatus Nanopelagicales bacterium]